MWGVGGCWFRTKRNPKSSQDIFIISPSSVGAFKSKTIKGKG